mmetsp:Transcript_22455/g.48884  ORF Transcript_22455/g.48884 Transcript_22455/m.48884 type:complete len:586 (-) Transcript_22455:317-2074(-)
MTRRYNSNDFGYDFADHNHNTIAATTEESKVQDEDETQSLIPQPPAAADHHTTTTDAVSVIAAASFGNHNNEDAPQSKQPETAAAEGGYKLFHDDDDDGNKNPDKKEQQSAAPQPNTNTTSPYRYDPPQGYRGGESYIDGSGDAVTTSLNGGLCCGALCCLVTVALVIAGGVLISYDRYQQDNDDNENAQIVLAGTLCIVLAVAACLCGFCALCIGAVTNNHHDDGPDKSSGGDPHHKEVKVRLRRLNDRYEGTPAQASLERTRLDVVGHIKELKEAARQEAKDKKDAETKRKKELERRVLEDLKAGTLTTRAIRQKYRPVTFLIVFDGDVMVSTLELLRKQVSVVVQLARPGHDKCVVLLTSPGGAVSQYGLAASQLVRIRKAGVHLTVCVDSVAASGGYMMASVADWICAAPFAVVGSIGVVTQIPNFQRFLNEHKIDAYLMTAGDYKRTIDVIGDVTEEGKAKLTEQLDDIHVAFKDHVALARPKLRENMEQVGTGENWLAVQAKEKGLVDEIMTSDEYLESICSEYDIIEILEKKEQRRGDLARLMGDSMGAAAASLKSVAERVKATAEAPERTPPAMAIV